MNQKPIEDSSTEREDSQAMPSIAKPTLLIDHADDLFTSDIMGGDVLCYDSTEALLYWEHSLPAFPSSFSGIGNILPPRDAIWIEWASAPFARCGVWVRTGSIPEAEQENATEQAYVLSALYHMLDDVSLVYQYVPFRKAGPQLPATDFLVLNTWALHQAHEKCAVPTASYAMYLAADGAMIDTVIYAVDALRETGIEVLSPSLTKALISLNSLNRYSVCPHPTHVTKRGFKVRSVQIKGKGFIQ